MHVRKMGAQTQHKTRPQVGRPNATQGTSASWAPQRTSTSWAPQRTSATQTQGTSARPQVGRPNATQGTSARWPPKRKTHLQRKRPHKGALGSKTSWRMDKNKFWLGGRLFNTASPRLGAPTQRKARLEDGRPNATQGTSASWAPQRNARHVRKLVAPTHVHNANARHVCTTQGTSARPQVGRHNATQGTSARWSPKRKTHPQRKRPHKGALG
jgi:hypothetical protein